MKAVALHHQGRGTDRAPGLWQPAHCCPGQQPRSGSARWHGVSSCPGHNRKFCNRSLTVLVRSCCLGVCFLPVKVSLHIFEPVI